MKAWQVTACGIRSIVSGSTRARAKYITKLSADDAGYYPKWNEIQAIRKPEYDKWAEVDESRAPWFEADIKRMFPELKK